LAAGPPDRPDQRRDGLFGAGGGGRIVALPGPHRDRLRRRRRIFDERTGNLDRPAARWQPIILLFNNNMYGTIRMHQERSHPFRVVGTDLVNPDFVVMAQSMGAHAERVMRSEEFAPALDRALAAGRPALIELCTDPEQISTRMSITELQARAERRQSPAAAN
jgi:hypothetical protein